MSEKKSSTNFTYHDPGRTFDGTPYQAASKAVSQSENVLRLLEKSLRDTNIQARNAFMQRQLDLHGKPNAELYEDSPEFKLLTTFLETAKTIHVKLTALNKAVSYDPINPPKE